MEAFSRRLLLFLLTSLLISTSTETLLRTVPERAASGGHSSGLGGIESTTHDVYCNSWRLSVETNNAGVWSEIPSACNETVMEYMNSEQYESDCMVAVSNALSYAMTVNISGDGTDLWIFDIDETLLSNMEYYAICGMGTYNATCYNEWLNSGKAPALPATLWLYQRLRTLGFQLVLLTGRSESTQNATENNLLLAGFSSWRRLILKDSSYSGKTALVFKSEKRAELEAEGYKIHGNVGDQWSDLLGTPMAARSFKIPNPLYYVE